MKSGLLAKEISETLAPFSHLTCVGGKLYLGSMFFLDFGAKFLASTRSGERIEIGEMTLSVRDVVWWLYHGGALVASAEGISVERFDRHMESFLGCTIAMAEQTNDEQLRIKLGINNTLVVDLTNLWDTDSNVIELALPDGRIASVDEKGRFAMDAVKDEKRARHWITSPHRH